MTRRQFFNSTVLLAAGCAAAKTEGQALRDTAPFRDLPPSAWRNARLNGLVMIWPQPSGLLSREACIAEREPGDALVVSGAVYVPDGVSPAPGVTVYAYNTDAEGYYCANHAEYPPRLRTEAMVAEAASRGSFTTIQTLRKSQDWVWRCAFNIKASRRCTFH